MNAVDCDETYVRCEVRSFLCENFLFGDDGARLDDHDSLIDRHVLDSTGFLELIAFLESRFGVSIEDLEMVPENLDSIASVTTLVVRKLTRADSSGLK
jgi:acyl carrier protein